MLRLVHDLIRHPLKLSLLGLLAGLPATSALAAPPPAGWVATQTPAQLPPGAAPGTLAPDLAAAASKAKPMSDTDPRLISITVSLQLNNPTGLNQAAAEAGRSGHFLTPQEIRDRFAPTQAQVERLANYLRRSGLQSIAIASNRMLVTAQGRPAVIQRAFHTRLEHFSYQGREVYANAEPVLVPAAFGPIVARVLGLENLHPMHTNPAAQP